MHHQRNNFFCSTYRRGFLAVVVAIATLVLTPQSSYADGVEWTIAPYFWAADVGLDLKVNDDPVIGSDIPFSDLVDKLDMAFMGHFEGRGERFGAFIDIIYLDLGDNKVVPVGPGGPILGDLIVDSDITIGLFELAGLYRIGRPAPGTAEFDILFGVRQVDVDQFFDITLPGPGGNMIDRTINVSETDVFAGGRVVGKFTEKWGYKVRADIGGGGTDGVFNVLAAVGYSFGQTGLFSLDLGYRYMTIKLSGDISGSSTETDIRMSGPVLGFIFNF